MAEMYVHTATVEPFLGINGLGVDMFGPPASLPCFLDDTRHQIRSTTGETVISESTLYTYPTNAGSFTINARVTVGANVSRVMKVNVNDSGTLDLPDHVAVSLT